MLWIKKNNLTVTKNNMALKNTFTKTPDAQDASGKTLFEKVVNSNMLLGSGSKNI